MNLQQQKELKTLAIKYAKSLSENGFSTELHYKFIIPTFKHEMTIYFYDKKSWYFELRFQGEFNFFIIYSCRESGQSINFSLNLSEKDLSKLIEQTEHNYETWLLDIESKKQVFNDNEKAAIRRQIESLQKKLDQGKTE